MRYSIHFIPRDGRPWRIVDNWSGRHVFSFVATDEAGARDTLANLNHGLLEEAA